MDAYSLKMKSFKRLDRPEYVGEYTFVVRVGVDDSNTVEIKDTVTMCKIVQLEEESHKSDEEYKPESDEGEDSDTNTKRAQTYQELVSFDPEKQSTNYKLQR